MERKNKTGKANRKNYNYYLADGTKITIVAGENGVSEELIAKLHSFDDEERNQMRRDEYLSPVNIGKEKDLEFDNLLDRNPYLADKDSDPLELLMNSVLKQEHSEKIERLTSALDMLTPKQKQTVYKKYYLNMTETAIALEEGVDISAICHRLKGIYKKLLKKMQKT